jgi:putative phosphoesterase
MQIAVISDTHLPRGKRRIPDACLERLRAADLILHAGDFASATAYEELALIGPPVFGVHGNIDDEELTRRLPAERVVKAGDVRIGMVHDAGPAKGRLVRMRGRFPEAHAAVFGHSHIPLHEEADGFQIFNPGSPTDRRKAPAHTMGLAIVEGDSVRFELLVVA